MKSIIYLVFFLGALSSGAFAAENAYVPKPRIMQIFIGGYSGMSYEVLYDGRVLKYYEAKNMFELKTATPEIIEATDKDWASFLKTLDDIKAWNWKRKYIIPEIEDGTVWNATIVYDFAKKDPIATFGSNSYPPHFDSFLSAVSALVGGKRFK